MSTELTKKNYNIKVLAWASTNNIRKEVVDYVINNEIDHEIIVSVAQWVTKTTIEEFLEFLNSKKDTINWYQEQNKTNECVNAFKYLIMN